jgi:hypothetical protein
MRRQSDALPWNTGRAASYGAVVGAVAAVFKLLAPWSGPLSLAADAREIAGAAFVFALLCGLAAALRNLIVRRFISPQTK